MSLDFKKEQYPFVGVNQKAKSELLKDILAFANSFRRIDAYILIGVEEIKGGRSKLVGIDEHLEDVSLQQFVNTKTQKPVEFSYRALELEGVKIGVIEIPIQERPVYLKRDYGILQKQKVYLRGIVPQI